VCTERGKSRAPSWHKKDSQQSYPQTLALGAPRARLILMKTTKEKGKRCDEGRSWEPFPELCVWGAEDPSGFGNGIRWGWPEDCSAAAEAQ
jgi:hypothetical protein